MPYAPLEVSTFDLGTQLNAEQIIRKIKTRKTTGFGFLRAVDNNSTV
jgi:hypothetical protein